MFLCLAALLLAMPQASAVAQEPTQPAGVGVTGAALESPIDQQQARPLAASGDTAIVSKNEAYNATRRAEGRLGVRLGNDMSYRVTGN